MKQMWCGAVLVAALGCDAEQEITMGEAEQSQIDVGFLDYRRIELTFPEEKLFAIVLVIGDEAVGEHEANTEYWYVETGNLEQLGVEDLELSYTDGNGAPASESGDQEFTLPLYPAWTRFSSDPVSGGYLYSSGTRHVRFTVDDDQISSVTWYQTLSSGTPQNILLDSEVTEAGSGAVTVPTGQTGYYIEGRVD